MEGAGQNRRKRDAIAQVLVVDDDPAIRQLLTDVLEMNGHEVRAAADGLTAVRALEEYRLDCVVLDIMMPGMDGYGVLRSIRGRDGDPVLVIVLTAATDPVSAAQAWAAGANAAGLRAAWVQRLLPRSRRTSLPRTRR